MKSGHLSGYPTGEDACRFCVLGAIYAEFGVGGWEEGPHEEVEEFLGRVSQSEYGLIPSEVNDRLGHVTTLALLDRAIELAEAGQS